MSKFILEEFKDAVYQRILEKSKSPLAARSECDSIDESELDEIDKASPDEYADGLMREWYE